MERFQLTAEQAFAILTRASRDANVTLHDRAQRLLDTGKPPTHSSGGHRGAARRPAFWTTEPG